MQATNWKTPHGVATFPRALLTPLVGIVLAAVLALTAIATVPRSASDPERAAAGPAAPASVHRDQQLDEQGAAGTTGAQRQTGRVAIPR